MLAAIAILMGLNACSSDAPQSDFEGVWHIPSDGYGALAYPFEDRPESFFFVHCNPEPVFGVKGGDYKGRFQTFRLTIDGSSWNLPSSYPNHGSILLVDGAEFGDLFARAKTMITFQTGDNWKRSFRPSPEIASFVAKCRLLEKTDPHMAGRRVVHR